MTTDGRGPSETIGSRIRSGLAWKAGSQVTLQVSRLVVALILARMLAPHDWGLAAMVIVFSGFVIVFTDNALGTALIQRRGLLEADRSTVFWISAAVGLVLMLAGVAASGQVADFYGEPDVRPLFAALSVGFFVSSLGTTHSALLVRFMQFRRLELRAIVATLAGACGGIAVAVQGFGAWAIVTQQLAEAVVSTALLWLLTPWRPSLTFSWGSVRRLGGFAGNVFGENLLYQAGRNIVNLLVGRFLGAAALGTYALASNVILVPFSRIAAPLQQVFFPAFSQIQDDPERMASMWIRATRLVAAISMPALVGLVVVAPDFVQVVLGERWEQATTVIQILVWAGLIQSLQTLNGEILLALDRSGTLLRFTMFWFVATVGGVLLGLQWGLVGVAIAYAAATGLAEALRAHLASRALGISVWRFARSLTGVAQATAVMAVAVLAAREALVAQNVPASARLAVLVLLGILVYLPCCAWRAKEVTLEIKGVIGRRRRRVELRVEALEARLLEP
jgi:O-antigen/teichoic acid export membrane protein